jgi:hypothetical protein
VRVKGEGLQACTVGSLDWSELRPYHYDVFEWHLPFFDDRIKVRFLVDDQGEVDAVSIPIEPAVENVAFVRKPPELAGELIAQLVGAYESPVEGLAFAVTAHDGKVYLSQAGGAPDEIRPYRLREDLVTFRTKRERYEFARDAEGISRLVLKTPYMTLEASRRASAR